MKTDGRGGEILPHILFSSLLPRGESSQYSQAGGQGVGFFSRFNPLHGISFLQFFCIRSHLFYDLVSGCIKTTVHDFLDCLFSLSCYSLSDSLLSHNSSGWTSG